MIIRNRQIRPSIRQVKRRNQQVSPFFLHLPNNIPILFIRPHWFSPWFRRFPWRVSPQFPQILFSPVLSILRKIKEILVENIVSVFVFFHRLHPFALQYLREPRNVFLRYVFRFWDFISRSGVGENALFLVGGWLSVVVIVVGVGIRVGVGVRWERVVGVSIWVFLWARVRLVGGLVWGVNACHFWTTRWSLREKSGRRGEGEGKGVREMDGCF